ncbi:MAG: hypothetical protein H7A20_07855 [Rhodanobacteraceae bacterium]|nr:hypothetical protein [Rhodanobacteraceae bacterium]HPF72040.1 hypothetical protein [Xanthomonadaceae bacterium]HRX98809.1 hypothetical protein [Xanthomonadaceae bacterium]
MRWLYFILAIVCFALLLKVQSLGFATILLIAMLVFMLAGVLSLVAARVDGRSRDQGQIVDVATLTQIRQQAEQRKAEAEPAESKDDDEQAPANPA